MFHIGEINHNYISSLSHRISKESSKQIFLLGEIQSKIKFSDKSSKNYLPSKSHDSPYLLHLRLKLIQLSPP